MTNARLVLTTAGSRDEADRIAKALVERELAACVNIVGPMTSVYRWQGKIENASEFLLVIKTREDAFDSVRDAITELHSYELPECIELPILRGLTDYLDWIDDNVNPD